MGGHYGSIHFRTDDASLVQTALEEVARDHGTKFLLAPLIDEWITAFPSENGQDLSIGEALAQKIKAPFLQCMVHDDDVFAYQFYKNGVLADQYNSCPDYFGGGPSAKGGDVAALHSVIPETSKPAELKRLLDTERFDFEVERLEQFAVILGLPNAVTAYEYLQDGERDGIQQWKKFVHIPDPATEKAAKRAAKATAVAAMKQMAIDGVLVLEIVGKKTSHKLFHESPVWCIDPTSNDVLLAWAGSPIGKASPAQLTRVNVVTGDTTPTKVELSNHFHCMAASPQSPWLAVGCACGNWKTQVWNLEAGTLMAEIPQSRAVSQVCFSSDGAMLFSLSEKIVTVFDVTGQKAIQSVNLPDVGRKMVLHPSGRLLIVESQGLVTLVDLVNLSVLKSFWIPEPPGPKRSLMEYAATSGMGQRFLNTVQSHVSKEEFDQAHISMARHFLPKQNVWSMSIGPLGNYLFCGTSAGLAVLEWAKIEAVQDMMAVEPLVLINAEQLIREDGAFDNQIIYAVPLDPAGRRILFAGLEGKIKFANLSDGRVGDLLVTPVRRSFWQLELTPDRAALVGTANLKQEGNKPTSASFQIWNYRALCAAADLNS